MFEWNDDDMYARTIALKKKNPNLVISLAVGGWNHEMGRKSKYFRYVTFLTILYF